MQTGFANFRSRLVQIDTLRVRSTIAVSAKKRPLIEGKKIIKSLRERLDKVTRQVKLSSRVSLRDDSRITKN